MSWIHMESSIRMKRGATSMMNRYGRTSPAVRSAAVEFCLGPGGIHQISFWRTGLSSRLRDETVHASYDLEYGRDMIEMHVDAVHEGQQDTQAVGYILL